ncbi:MAG: DUF6364 family protein [Acidobacteriota bacterium]
MSKLTLSVEKSVVTRARLYAKQQGISVSQMVETYLAAVAAPPGEGRDAPVLQSLRGCLKKADVEGYRKHLATKYR